MNKLTAIAALAVLSAPVFAQHAAGASAIPALEDGGLVALVVLVGLAAGWAISRGRKK